MKESVIYQEIAAEAEERGRDKGRDEGMHTAIYAFGKARFGEPDSATRDALEAIHDADRLQRIAARVAIASSWANLFETP